MLNGPYQTTEASRITRIIVAHRLVCRPAFLAGLGLTLALIALTWLLGRTTKAHAQILQDGFLMSKGDTSIAMLGKRDVHQEPAHTPGITQRTTLTDTLSYHVYMPLVAHNNAHYYKVYEPISMVNLSLQRSDLLITHVAFESPDIVAGQPFLFSVVVRNQGTEDTAHGGVPEWYTVEVYIKDRAFTPAGPPVDALDHAGGFCSDASLNCVTGTRQPQQLVFLDNLSSGESREIVMTLTFPNADLYDLYVQVDTTWSGEGLTGQPWGQHREEGESNNLFAVEDIIVPAAP